MNLVWKSLVLVKQLHDLFLLQSRKIEYGKQERDILMESNLGKGGGPRRPQVRVAAISNEVEGDEDMTKKANNGEEKKIE